LLLNITASGICVSSLMAVSW